MQTNKTRFFFRARAGGIGEGGFDSDGRGSAWGRTREDPRMAGRPFLMPPLLPEPDDTIRVSFASLLRW